MFEWLIDYIMENKYLLALVIFMVFYTLSELVVFISEKVLLRFTKKTKTNIDDILVKKTHRPCSLLLIGIGIKLALISLEFGGKVGFVVAGITNTFIAVILIYLAYVVLDTLIGHWGLRFAEKTESTLDDHLIVLLHKALSVAAVIVGALLILKIWGIEIVPLLAGLGIAGIAVAFALQGTLSNLFGGVSLILDKNIKVGEVIAVDTETKGTVMDIGLRSTKIKTFDNEVVIVPNSELAGKKLQNLTQPDPSGRVIIPFGIAYGSDVDKVKKIVIKEINKIEGLKKDSEPSVRFVEMGDSALLFKAYFWMESYTERFRAKDEANTLIYNILNKNKISIPFPQIDVHIKRK